MNKQSNKITALYCRIDHGKHDALCAIQLQQELLVQYAKEKGVHNLHIFADCGFSGVTFERPEFQHMLCEIKAGRVGALVVTNISRLGRDTFNVARLIEEILPRYGVTLRVVKDICPEVAAQPQLKGGWV